ncbi:competence/damage-inducible protein A [Actinomycetospora sp. TBRC 11914]|uniref:competence/damage-inducible protein A n=1 Tax=Actinomycetospora sp. TBRC 11914 TaxID=2729387 RepID=UPI00145FB80C|nr:competence/damage-inducible protein A [Actinomycetospora sp. TBRC 11914]NMO91942.1 competence/damage-inducible protein A [Actinomycetospora sp. TBRC 11914]
MSLDPGADRSGGGSAPTAGIVATGSELLAGRVHDANGPWLAERLGELGIDVVQILLVGDRPDEMEAALRSLRGVDLVVTSGGLGPTADDLTAAVVADVTGRPLELDEHMEKVVGDIISRFADRLRWDADALAEANRKQAMVPRGATAIRPVGTAPGLAVPPGGEGAYAPTVLVLPGPPREVRGMWDDALATAPMQALLARTAPFEETHLRLFGVPESEIAATLRAVGEHTDLAPLEITTCLRDFTLEVDLRRRPDDAAARAAHDAVVAEIDARHGKAVFSRTGETIDEILFGLLEGRTIATAESCTGGLLAGRLTAPAGASAHVEGGIVSYSNEAKEHLLGVPHALIATHGAVSPEAAHAMAGGAIERFGADVAVAISGIAGPGGGTAEKPVGYVCFSVRTADGREIARDPVLPGERGDVRERSVVLAMHLVRRILTEG